MLLNVTVHLIFYSSCTLPFLRYLLRPTNLWHPVPSGIHLCIFAYRLRGPLLGKSNLAHYLAPDIYVRTRVLGLPLRIAATGHSNSANPYGLHARHRKGIPSRLRGRRRVDDIVGNAERPARPRRISCVGSRDAAVPPTMAGREGASHAIKTSER